MISENLDNLASSLTRKLTSPEAALLLAENYAKQFYEQADPDAEYVLGAVMWRDEEDPSLLSPYKTMISEYVKLEIRKHFGYTLNEYLNLSLYEASVLREQAEVIKSDYNKMASDVQREVSRERKNLKVDTGGMEDLLEEM